MNKAKILLNATVVVAILTCYCLRAYAEPLMHPSADELLPESRGILTCSGSVSINGNAVGTGATVVSGSTITTAPGALAIIQVGGLGRVTVGPATSATLTFIGGHILVNSICPDTQIAVKQGGASVKLKDGSIRVLSAGQDTHAAGNVEVTVNYGSDVVVNCGSEAVSQQAAPNTGGGLLSGRAGWLGLLVLGGLAVGIAVVIASSGSPSPRQPVSSFRP